MKNGHNGNGHPLAGGVIISFHDAADKLGDELAEDRRKQEELAKLPKLLEACDLCGRMAMRVEDGTHFRVHFAQTETRDPKTGIVYPPCPRSWPPKPGAKKAAPAP